MKCNDLLKRIIDIIESHIKDNKDGYMEIKSDYWLGRLIDSEEILRQIIHVDDEDK